MYSVADSWLVEEMTQVGLDGGFGQMQPAGDHVIAQPHATPRSTSNSRGGR